jgi:hypothetical protein
MARQVLKWATSTSLSLVASGAAALLLSACSSAPSASTSSSSSTLHRQVPTTSNIASAHFGVDAPICTPAQLAIEQGPVISPPSGHNPVSLELRNQSATKCSLSGYPTISMLVATGSVIPFTYKNVGSLVVTSQPPREVVIPPNHYSFVTMDKMRCDLGNKVVATTLSVTLPANDTPLTPSLSFVRNQPLPAYCGLSDPGSTIYVSPVEPTLAETLATH